MSDLRPRDDMRGPQIHRPVTSQQPILFKKIAAPCWTLPSGVIIQIGQACIDFQIFQ